MYRTILFDLDGTLTDPGIGITNSVAYALDKFGIHPASREELYPFIGPPLIDSFQMFFHFPPEDAKQAVAYYREYYNGKGIYENTLYEGIEGMLRSLQNLGCRMMVATSKPEEFTLRILDYFHIRSFFSFVAAATMDGTRGTKEEIIAYALDKGHIADKQSAVMVGDRKYDILGAKKMGLASIGVLYGYGSEEELIESGAGHLARQVGDIKDIICQDT